MPPGVNGEVLCSAILGNDFYVGGRFTRAGNVATGGIARWDGRQWQMVGDGIDGNVGSLFVHGNSLYVGGQFRTLGAISATNIARWTRNGWKPLGKGIPVAGAGNSDQYVAAITVHGRDVYVGGSFAEAGGVAATNIAKWDGRHWSALGNGVGRQIIDTTVFGRVVALEWFQGNLFAGGIFDWAGNVPAQNLARWNGKSWQEVGGGVQGGNTFYSASPEGIHSGLVNVIKRQGPDLLVGGDFTQADDVAATNLTRLHGRRWLQVGGGVQGGSVNAICFRGPEIVVGGSFERAGKVAANNVARWDGRRWKTLDSGVHGYASALATKGSQLFVGGYFGLAGDIPAAFVARWSRGNWAALKNRFAPGVVPPPVPPYWPDPTNALIGEVEAIAAKGSNVFVGGRLFSAGLFPVNNVAHWNGSQWSDMGGGIPKGYVRKVVVIGSDVYVAGSFVLPQAGATNLARWDGTQWHNVLAHAGILFGIEPFPQPPDPPIDERYANYPVIVFNMAAVGERLYVRGIIFTPERRRSFGETVWNGDHWSALPPLASQIPGMHVESKVVIGDGTNLYTDALPYYFTNRFVEMLRWDGTDWSILGAGLAGAESDNPIIRAMAMQGTNLFVGGEGLSYAGDLQNTPTNLLRWDGTAWSTIGVPTTGESMILALAATTNWLYAAGAFTNVNALNIARWDGTYWSPVASGVGKESSFANGLRDYVRVMEAADGRVYVGGSFGEAGDYSTFNFAVWDENLWTPYFSPIVPYVPPSPTPVAPTGGGSVSRVLTGNPPLPLVPAMPLSSPAGGQ